MSKPYNQFRSVQRRDSTRAIAYACEAHGREWVSLRDAIPFVADLCGVETANRRRSDITIECMAKLEERGYVIPPEYVPPWVRGDAPPILRPPRGRKAVEARLAAFYDSWEWKRVRYDYLRTTDRRCMCCGSPKWLHVDHIVPVRKDWSRRLDPTNLQVLCEECNRGKASRDTTDFRTDRKLVTGLDVGVT